MRCVFLTILLIATMVAKAQHCPWDCSGLILLKTEVAKEEIYKLQPMLVDENKKLIVDTLSGTNKPTYDTCSFLYYDDFLANRTERAKLHQWYKYDTVLHFAAGYFVARINYCDYRNRKLYLRFEEPHSRDVKYKYVEIPASSVIHLHEYSREIQEKKMKKIRDAVKKMAMKMTCKKWKLPKEHCK
jgi:hypothetical protein